MAYGVKVKEGEIDKVRNSSIVTRLIKIKKRGNMQISIIIY